MFDEFVSSPEEQEYKARPEVNCVLETIRKEVDVVLIDTPFEYIKDLQSKFPYEQISFTNEYYDTLGIERPAGGEYRKIERVTGFRIFIPNNPQPNKAGIPSGLGNRGK